MSNNIDSLEKGLRLIRINLYEETKNMTTAEKIAYIKARTDPVLQKFGIKMSNLKPVTPRKRQAIATI